MSVEFLDKAWDEYLSWQSQDRKTLKRINKLIISIQRDGLANGLGKPERLKYQNGWSRRINNQDRLVYTTKKGKLILLDESFSNIDLKSAKDILNNLLNHVETVIVVSHRNEEIDPQIFKAVDIK